MKLRPTSFLRSPILLVALFSASTLNADPAPSPQNPAMDSEAQALGRIINELDALKGVIQQAEDLATPAQRFPFDYDQLRLDLATIRLGIETHLAIPRRPGPAVPPLRGSYRQ